MDTEKPTRMEYEHINKFVGNALKRWRLPLLFFFAFFSVSLYTINQEQDRYCDEALVILGTKSDYLDKKVMIEDPYVSESRLNVAISGLGNSIEGTASATLDAFDFEKRRVMTVSLKGKDPHLVRVALKNVLAKLASVHDEKYSRAAADYAARISYLKKARINLERMISNLSADKSIPPEAYQSLQVELFKVKGTTPPPPTQTRFIMPDSSEATLCGGKKSIVERVLFSVGWGVIGGLMAIFGVYIWQTHSVARGYRK